MKLYFDSKSDVQRLFKDRPQVETYSRVCSPIRTGLLRILQPEERSKKEDVKVKVINYNELVKLKNNR